VRRISLKFIVLITFLWASGSLASPGRLVVEGQPGTEAYVKYLKKESPQLISRIFKQVGVASPRALRVFVARDAAEMRKRALAEQGGLPPEWAAGLAYPKRGVIYVHFRAPLEALQQTFLHELSHIAFGQLDRFDRAPRWFDEGLAVWQSEGASMERGWLLTKAALTNGLHPWDQLDRGFPDNGARAGVAYAQAVHFVGFLNEEFGREKFGQLLRSLSSINRPFSESLESVYGLSAYRLEARWRETLRTNWGWISVLADSTTLFVLCAILLIIGWYRRRRDRRVQLARLKQSEADIDLDELLNTDLGQKSKQEPYDHNPPTYH
jgi:hypothetical protein